jgi:hypothetical protein
MFLVFGDVAGWKAAIAVPPAAVGTSDGVQLTGPKTFVVGKGDGKHHVFFPPHMEGALCRGDRESHPCFEQSNQTKRSTQSENASS